MDCDSLLHLSCAQLSSLVYGLNEEEKKEYFESQQIYEKVHRKPLPKQTGYKKRRKMDYYTMSHIIKCLYRKEKEKNSVFPEFLMHISYLYVKEIDINVIIEAEEERRKKRWS